MSSSFKLTIKNENDSERTLNFVRGTLASGEITGRESRASEVRIDFELDRSIFDLDSQLNPYFYLDFMKTLAVLNRGRTIVYGFPDDEGTSEVKLKFENGLYDLLEIEKLRSIWDGYYLSTHIEFQSKECEAEIAFSVWENPTNLPFQVSFVNHAISPENGVHLEAVIESVRSTLNKYLREHFDKSELDRISERAIRRALNCAIHVKMARPHFEGSYKGKLLSPEIIKPIKDAVSTKLLADLNNDGSQAIEMVKYLSRNATLNQR